jgi:hypothetical protein
MISFIVGILILVAIFGLVYLVRFRDTSKGKSTDHPVVERSDVKTDDIVLASLTQPSKTLEGTYAILWNGTPNKKYEYIIWSDGKEIAKGEATSPSSVFKIRGLPLEPSKTYDVQVGNTRVRIPFTPPTIIKVSRDGDELDVETDVIPTNIEVIVSSVKIPLTECQIKIDPPGFGCKLPPDSQGAEQVLVIYNGQGCVNILM